ncbi:MAG: histidine phosphatase family protein, partial [Gammaproteobacteria bacterium]|nr:histidine phosphatase family protein [Gammaproteobacteria bacterium]
FYEAYRHIPFQRIFTTELLRTKQSIEPFAEQTEIPIEPIAELNEINWGYLEGKTPTKKDKALFLDTIERWAAGQLDHAIAGGETPLEMFERQKRGLDFAFAGSVMESALTASASSALLQYFDQFHPPWTVPAHPRIGPQKLLGSGKSAIHAIPPDQTIGAFPDPPHSPAAACKAEKSEQLFANNQSRLARSALEPLRRYYGSRASIPPRAYECLLG